MQRRSSEMMDDLHEKSGGHMLMAANKEALFDMVDKDGSGEIDRAEFNRLYDMIKKETVDEMEKESALERAAEKAIRKTRKVQIFAAILGCSLAVSVLANAGTTFGVVKLTEQLTTSGRSITDPSGNMLATADEPRIYNAIMPEMPAAYLRAVEYLNFTLPLENSNLVGELHLKVESMNRFTCKDETAASGACDPVNDAEVHYTTNGCDVHLFYLNGEPTWAYSNVEGTICEELFRMAGMTTGDSARRLAQLPEHHSLRMNHRKMPVWFGAAILVGQYGPPALLLASTTWDWATIKGYVR